MANPKDDQVSLAERLQLLLLRDFEKGFTSGTITPTDRATLARLLSQNGWSLDPALIPKGIRDKLTKSIDPKQFDEDDADIGGH